MNNEHSISSPDWINNNLALVFATAAVTLATLFIIVSKLLSNMGVRTSKHHQPDGAHAGVAGKQVLNAAFSGATTGPQTLAHRRSKNNAVTGDKKKFLDPTVLETMENIDEEDVRKFERFNQWLEENGSVFPNLEYKQYADGIRGVHTTRPIPAMVQLMAIPERCLITDAMGRGTEQGQRLMAVEGELSVPNHCQVIVYMMNGIEKGNTFFQPYYDVLPENFNSFPIFWDSKKLGWLRGSSLVDEIEERKLNMRNDYNTICKALPEFRRFTFKQFLWCRTAVGSRNFSITVGNDKVTAMVPFADMLNHFRPRETCWRFDNSQGAFTMTSLCPLAGGHQVMDSYGKKCNSKFLLHYGFTIEDNREADGRCQNEVQLSFKLPDFPDPHRSLRRQFVHDTFLTRLSMNAEDDGTVDAFLFARVAVATLSELEFWDAKSDNRASPELPISLENELKAIKFIAAAAEAKLRRYPSTQEEDDEIIASEPPFSDRRHAAIVIRSEKQVLRFYTDLVGHVTPLLKLAPRQRNREIRSRGEDSDIDRFLQALNNDLLHMGR